MDDMKITVTGSQVYKAISNYLHNEMQFTREDVIKMIDERLERIVKVHLDERMKQNSFERMFRLAIVDIIKGGVQTSIYTGPTPFDEAILKTMKTILREEMEKMFDIKVEKKTK